MKTNTAGPHRLNPENITWTREVQPREQYRIVYLDAAGEKTVRVVELLRVGHHGSAPYLGVMHEGRFKTLRHDRVLEVQERLDGGNTPSLQAAISYRTLLPAWPLEQSIFRVETVAKSSRTWRVDLKTYTCTCPEGRIRKAKGYAPGQVGFVCPHMARAILKQLPDTAAGWTPELRAFLSNPLKIHIDNLR